MKSSTPSTRGVDAPPCEVGKLNEKPLGKPYQKFLKSSNLLFRKKRTVRLQKIETLFKMLSPGQEGPFFPEKNQGKGPLAGKFFEDTGTVLCTLLTGLTKHCRPKTPIEFLRSLQAFLVSTS